MKKLKIKDKPVRIFREVEAGNQIVKEYIHDTDTTLKAYVRQLSSSEQASVDAVQDASIVQFTVNRRLIVVDMFVEFKGKTYQISGVDEFEFYESDVVFIANEINSKMYDETIWRDSVTDILFELAGGTGVTGYSGVQNTEIPESTRASFVPTKSGHTFTGWFTSDDLIPGTVYDFDVKTKVPILDITLYAGWTEDE